MHAMLFSHSDKMYHVSSRPHVVYIQPEYVLREGHRCQEIHLSTLS